MIRCAFLIAAWMVAMPAQAEPVIWSAEQTHEAVQNDEVILLDIRRDAEWRETGLAEGALPVSMHTDQFGAQLSAILSARGDRPIALICATGGRTDYVVSVLEQNGIAGIIDVSEGMLGNHRGSGWLKRGLPVVDLETAQARYEAFSAE